ncbi:MAG: oligogalacturonate lyase family protein, partial [Pyrinomonadaceae bacterium]
MKNFILLLLTALFITVTAKAQTSEPPRNWIDPDTGHRIVRLSNEPGSSSFYFHQNAYTASGDKFVFSTHSGLSTYDFKTKKIEQIVEGRTGNVIVGRKTREVFYLKGETAYETNIDTKETREIVKDARLRSGSGFAVNADETLLGGSMVVGAVPQDFRPQAPPTPGRPAATPVPRGDNYPGKGEMMERRLAAKIPMALYT